MESAFLIVLERYFVLPFSWWCFLRKMSSILRCTGSFGHWLLAMYLVYFGRISAREYSNKTYLMVESDYTYMDHCSVEVCTVD